MANEKLKNLIKAFFNRIKSLFSFVHKFLVQLIQFFFKKNKNVTPSASMGTMQDDESIPKPKPEFESELSKTLPATETLTTKTELMPKVLKQEIASYLDSKSQAALKRSSSAWNRAISKEEIFRSKMLEEMTPSLSSKKTIYYSNLFKILGAENLATLPILMDAHSSVHTNHYSSEKWRNGLLITTVDQEYAHSPIKASQMGEHQVILSISGWNTPMITYKKASELVHFFVGYYRSESELYHGLLMQKEDALPILVQAGFDWETVEQELKAALALENATSTLKPPKL